MLVTNVLCATGLLSTLSLAASIRERQACARSVDDQLLEFESRSSSSQMSTRAAAANSPKYVVAHHMVGNTFPYVLKDWANDIALASPAGIDGFALNSGRDDWQPARVADAYEAARQSNTGFKLFISLDMSSFPCASPQDAQTIRNFVHTYLSHPNQLKYASRAVVSTFAGESCTFGEASPQLGWDKQFVHHPDLNGQIYFIPSFFIDPARFGDFGNVMDGDFNWNAAWPTAVTSSFVHCLQNSGLSPEEVQSRIDDYIGTMVPDKPHLDALSRLQSSSGVRRAYMAPVSPWFFTHYGPNSFNKNWIYLADRHLYNRRWESLIAARDQIDIVQAVTWNDYGESHYIGPIEGAQPNSQAWVNGFDHTAWLSMTKYYASTFKTGVFPDLDTDQLYMWSRPHPFNAVASNDPVGPPANSDITQDQVWVVAMVKQKSTVILSTDPNLASDKQKTFDVSPGTNKLSIPITPGGIMYGVIQRNGKTILQLKPQGFTFNGSPATYNFNAFVAGAQAQSNAKKALLSLSLSI